MRPFFLFVTLLSKNLLGILYFMYEVAAFKKEKLYCHVFIIALPGLMILTNLTNFPTPAPIRAFLDFCVKIKLGRNINQYLGLKNLVLAFTNLRLKIFLKSLM
jgi:hypothetical protein